MKKDNNKRLIIVIAILLLLVSTVALTTYALFNYTKKGVKENSITLGSITFLYTEVSEVGRGIKIEDSLPISDNQGKLLTGSGNVFEFKITSTTPQNISIPYFITARKSESSNLDDSAVRIYLTKTSGQSEEELLLDNYSNLNQASNIDASKYTEKVLFASSVPANSSNYEQNFKLRMWIDENTDFSPVKDKDGNDTYPYNSKSFTLTVNVYTGTVIAKNETKQAGLYDTNNNLLISWNSLVNDYGLDVEKDYDYKTYKTDPSSLYYILKNNNLDGVLVIPEGITKIGDMALRGGASSSELLEGVVLPSTITSLGLSSISYTKITNIEIPDSVTSIGDYTFNGSSSLSRIKLPKNITKIPSGFANYTAITTIGKLNSGAEIEIPDSVTEIGDYAFYYYTPKISSLDLPNSIINIGRSAFSHIEAGTVVLPDSIKSIGSYAFENSANTAFYVPSSVETIEANAFYDADMVYYNGAASNSPWGAKNINNINSVTLTTSNYKEAGIESLSGDVVIPETYTYNGANYTVVAIGSQLFNNNTSVTSVTLPNTIVSIGSYAFNNATNLKSINLPEGLQTIATYAFNNTTSLESITLPSTLTQLGNFAFNHSYNLNNTTIKIPAALNFIGSGSNYFPTHIFYNAGKDNTFTAFEVDSNNSNYQAIDGILYSKDGELLVSIPRGKKFTNNTYEMPNTVTRLAELSFSRNLNITKVIISDNLIINGYDVGELYNTNLNSGNTLSIASYQFAKVAYYDVRETNQNYKSIDGVLYSIDGKTLVAIPPFYNGAINIPEGVTKWQKEAMWTDITATYINKNITNINIPSTLTTIDTDTINYLNNLISSNQLSVTIDSNNTSYKIAANNTIEKIK